MKNSLLSEASRIWTMLDDMSMSDPERYNAFIRSQLDEGRRLSAFPVCKVIVTCSKTCGETFYVHIHEWARVKASASLNDPIPIVGGNPVNTKSEAGFQVTVYMVAFNDHEVQTALTNNVELENLVLISLQFISQQHHLEIQERHEVALAECAISRMQLFESFRIKHNEVMDKIMEKQTEINADCVNDVLQRVLAYQFQDDEKQTESDMQLQCCANSTKAFSKFPLVQVVKEENCISFDCKGSKLIININVPGITKADDITLDLSNSEVHVQSKLDEAISLKLLLPQTIDCKKARARFNKLKKTLKIIC